MNIEKANSAIRNAWIAGIISGGITLILSLIGAFGFNPWNLIDAFLILGLTFGIYRKNRACAVILFVYWILAKIFQIFQMWEEPGMMVGVLPLAIVFGYYFFQGMRGTFAYHKIAKAEIKNV